MGDSDDFMPILKEEKGEVEFGMPGGNCKCKVMKEPNGERQSLLRKSKVMMKEELKDSEEATPPTSLIVGQSSLKKVCVSKGVLLKEIGALHEALLASLNRIIA